MRSFDPNKVGSLECRSCHEAVYEQWKETPHARALLLGLEHDAHDLGVARVHRPAHGTDGERGLAVDGP